MNFDAYNFKNICSTKGKAEKEGIDLTISHVFLSVKEHVIIKDHQPRQKELS